MDLVPEIMEIVAGAEMNALLGLLAGNLLLSIIAAIQKGVFSFRKLGDFVPTRIVPLIAYIVAAVMGKVVDGWTAVVVAVYVGLVALYTTGIIAALKSITGFHIPNILSEKE